LPSVLTLGEIRSSANGVRRIILRAMLESTPEGRLKQLKLHDEELVRYAAAIEKYRKSISSP